MIELRRYIRKQLLNENRSYFVYNRLVNLLFEAAISSNQWLYIPKDNSGKAFEGGVRQPQDAEELTFNNSTVRTAKREEGFNSDCLFIEFRKRDAENIWDNAEGNFKKELNKKFVSKEFFCSYFSNFRFLLFAGNGYGGVGGYIPGKVVSHFDLNGSDRLMVSQNNNFTVVGGFDKLEGIQTYAQIESFLNNKEWANHHVLFHEFQHHVQQAVYENSPATKTKDQGWKTKEYQKRQLVHHRLPRGIERKAIEYLKEKQAIGEEIKVKHFPCPVFKKGPKWNNYHDYFEFNDKRFIPQSGNEFKKAYENIVAVMHYSSKSNRLYYRSEVIGYPSPSPEPDCIVLYENDKGLKHPRHYNVTTHGQTRKDLERRDGMVFFPGAEWGASSMEYDAELIGSLNWFLQAFINANHPKREVAITVLLLLATNDTFFANKLIRKTIYENMSLNLQSDVKANNKHILKSIRRVIEHVQEVFQSIDWSNELTSEEINAISTFELDEWDDQSDEIENKLVNVFGKALENYNA